LRRCWVRAAALCSTAVAVCAQAAENPAARVELPAVNVISTTPLPGLGVPLDQVPANAQAASAADIDRRQALDLTEFLERSFDSVSINGSQANPFQPDLNFRGFTASPLLGTPQGLSVFVDGVRVNEAFGDVVNWDLIPRNAISSVGLVPGSNPVFGLNTLGGALAIHTKSGFSYPGFGMRATAGSYGRVAAELELGGHGDRVDYFVAGNRLQESGWRDHSRSDLQQLFAKAGFQSSTTDLDVSITLADNTLNGTQALPLSMLGNPRQAYTWPDRTRNQLTFLNSKASHFFNEKALVTTNVYYRSLKTQGYFSNVNDDFDPATGEAPGNTSALNNSNVIDQRMYGAAVQLTVLGEVLGRQNEVNVGFSSDFGNTSFVNQQQEASFTSDRGTIGNGEFATHTDVQTRNRYLGLYVANTIALTSALRLTVSGRYNDARIDIADRSGLTPALNGSHRFSRFNPAAGVTYNLTPRVTTFGGYNRGTRVPTPAELSCSDPGAPCQLPSVFLADPPLKPVLASTWEFGARGTAGDKFKWRAAVYRADLDDDIQFVNTSRLANAGFFQNIGTTRRQGLELAADYRMGSLGLSASYAYLDATYRTGFTLPSRNNTAAFDSDGDGIPDSIQVQAGNRIPALPRQLLKLRAEHRTSAVLMMGIDMLASSSQFARGDENNADAAGAVPGYAIVNFDLRYTLQPGWQLLAKVHNVFDRRYETFGVLGTNFFRGPGNTFDANAAGPEQFRSSGAPRGAWIGVAYHYDEKKR
jgi:iron complex outermembrane recepter protein